MQNLILTEMRRLTQRDLKINISNLLAEIHYVQTSPFPLFAPLRLQKCTESFWHLAEDLQLNSNS